MTAVIDASVLVSALVDSGWEGVWSERVVAAGTVAPNLVLVEVANILRRMESGGRLTAVEAQNAFENLLVLEIELFPFEPFANRIWSLRSNVTSYDAWYVAIAEASDLALATLDRRLARASGPTCEFLLPL